MAFQKKQLQTASESSGSADTVPGGTAISSKIRETDATYVNCEWKHPASYKKYKQYKEQILRLKHKEQRRAPDTNANKWRKPGFAGQSTSSATYAETLKSKF